MVRSSMPRGCLHPCSGSAPATLRHKRWSELTQQERFNAGLAALVGVDWVRAVVHETGGRSATA